MYASRVPYLRVLLRIMDYRVSFTLGCSIAYVAHCFRQRPLVQAKSQIQKSVMKSRISVNVHPYQFLGWGELESVGSVPSCAEV